MSELLLEQLSAFGDYSPSIPFADGVDKEALIEGDTDPIFVTLPIAEVGAKSKNGRIYGQAQVESIVQQINAHRNGGNKGHLRADERSSKFDLPVLQWVGAMLDSNGKAYGKAYIPKYASDVREYIKNAKATRSRIATSIYGTATMNGDAVDKLEIESIDLADPFRAGVSAAVAVPVITTEMKNGDNTMSDNTPDVISELRNDRNQAIQELAEVRAELKAEKAKAKVIAELVTLLDTEDVFKRVAEMADNQEKWQPVIELLGDKPLVKVQEMQTTISDLRHSALVHTIVDAIHEKVKFENARAAIAEMMGIERDADGVASLNRVYADSKEAITRLDALLERDTVKEMIQSMVFKASGGRTVTHKQFESNWQDAFIEEGKRRANSITGGNK